MDSKLIQFFSALNQHCCRKKPVMEFEGGCTKDGEEQEDKEEEPDVSQTFLQTEKNQPIALLHHLERQKTNLI